MNEDAIVKFLSEPLHRMVLSQIIAHSRSVSDTEIINAIPLTRRSAVYGILDKLAELNLIHKQEIQFGGIKRVFFTPNHKLLASELFKKVLKQFDDLEWPSALVLDFKYSWDDFPDCLRVGDSVHLNIIYGSWLIEAASTMDSLYTPELTQLLTYWFVKYRQTNIEQICIRSFLDYQAGSVKNDNLLVIGSGAVNRITAEIMDLYGNSLPIRFLSPSSKSIFSSITNETYGEQSDRGLLSGIVGLVPNPWNRSKVVILCAGAKYAGTQAALKVLCDDLTAQIFQKSRKLSNHPQLGEIPIRIVKAEGEDILSSILRQRGNKIEQYTFLE